MKQIADTVKDFFSVGETVDLPIITPYKKSVAGVAKRVSGGWEIECKQCGKNAVKKTEKGEYCSSSCRVKAFRKRGKKKQVLQMPD